MRGGEQEKVTVIAQREREELCFTSKRSLAKDSHLHDEWFLAFDFKENQKKSQK